MKKYNTSKEVRLLYFLAVLIAGYFAITNEPMKGSVIFSYVVFIILLVRILYETYSIEIHENNIIRFNKIVFSKTYEIKDIIKFQRGTSYCDYIIFKNGKEYIPTFMKDAPGLRASLKEINPSIESE